MESIDPTDRDIQVTPNDLESQYPSVDLAYELGVSSYETALKRWDAMEGRITTLVSIAVSLTLAIPVLSKALKLAIEPPWIVLTLLVFLGAMASCLSGRLYGTIKLVDPGVLYENYLDDSHWEFKKNFIYWAGVHFRANVKVIETKWRLYAVATFLLCLEMVLVILWVSPIWSR